MAELGRRAHSRVLFAEPGAVTRADPAPLRGRRGAPCFRLTRLRLGDDEPVGVQHTTVLTGRCPGVERHDFAHASLYAVLATEHALVVREIEHTVGAAVADDAHARLLGVAAGDPLLVVHTTALLARREILEYTTSHYRADRYEYTTRHVF
jgi:GntR family transcriptional regulator